MIAQTQKQANRESSKLLEKLIQHIPFAAVAVLFACCLVIEIGHIELSKECRDQIYSTLGSIMFYVSILLNTIYGRKYGLGWIRSLIFSFLSFQLVFSYISVAWTDLDILVFGSGTVASYRSIVFMPLLCLILSRFCKVDILNLCDFLTPYFFFNHGAVTIACWIEGCCAGKPWPWGVLNPMTGITAFPTQPCIILLSTAVAYWGLNYSQKHAYRANGMVFANSLCLYGFFRYLIELFTDDPRVWWMLSWLAVCSLVMIVQGFFLRYMIGKQNKIP